MPLTGCVSVRHTRTGGEVWGLEVVSMSKIFLSAVGRLHAEVGTDFGSRPPAFAESDIVEPHGKPVGLNPEQVPVRDRVEGLTS